MANKLKKLQITFSDQTISNVEKDAIYLFHLEEGISRPYGGYAKVRTKDPIDIGSMDLTNSYVEIQCGLAPQNDIQVADELTEERTVWALIRSIKYLGKQSFEEGSNDVLNDYMLELESPLSRFNHIKSHHFFYKEKIYDIITKLLSSQKLLLAGLKLNINVDRLKTYSWLSENNLSFQQGEESDFDFLNRLLIAYGINYIQCHSSDGITIFFSADQDFSNDIKEIVCTTDPKMAEGKSAVLLEKFQYGKEHAAIAGIKEIAENFSSEFLTQNVFGEHRSDTVAQNTLEVKRNIRRRLERDNAVFSSEVQDLRPIAGFILSDEYDSLFGSKRKFLIEKSVTHLCSIVTETQPVKIQLEGILLKHAKTDLLGSFVPNALLKNLTEETDPAVTVLQQAVVCDSSGNTDGNSVAIYDGDNAADTEMFYAKLSDGSKVLVHAVHSLLYGGDRQAMVPIVGDRILIIKDRSTYYFYGFLGNHLNALSSQSDVQRLQGVSEVLAGTRNPYDIDGFGNELGTEYAGQVALKLNRFKSDTDYVLALLLQGPRCIDTFVYAKSVSSGDANIYDDKYLNNYKDDVKTKCEAYKSSKKTLTDALKGFRSDCEALVISEADPENESFKEKINDLKKTYKLDEYKAAYADSQKELVILAGNIVKGLAIDDVSSGGLKSRAEMLTDGNYSLDVGGELTLHAASINILSDGPINMHAKSSIGMAAVDAIAQNVGSSSVSIKVDGTTIYAPAAYSGCNVNRPENAADLLSSTFSVKGFSGITGKAFDVSINANNNFSLGGNLGCGIKMGYGTVNVVGAELNVDTIGRFEQTANIAKFTVSLAADIITSLAATDKSAMDLKNNIINTVFTGYDDFIQGKDFIANKFDDAKKKNTDAERTFTYIQTVISWIDYVIDCVYFICKQVYVYMDWVQEEKEKKGKSTKDDRNAYLVPFPNSERSWLDQIRLYIDYLKVVNSLVVAGANAYFHGSSGFLKPSLTTMKITSQQIKMETDEYNFIDQNQNVILSASAGSAAAITRATTQQQPAAQNQQQPAAQNQQQPAAQNQQQPAAQNQQQPAAQNQPPAGPSGGTSSGGTSSNGTSSNGGSSSSPSGGGSSSIPSTNPVPSSQAGSTNQTP